MPKNNPKQTLSAAAIKTPKDKPSLPLLWDRLPDLLDHIAYLDIETTGLGYPPQSHSTTITFYYRGQVFQEHEARKKVLLINQILERCSILATYYGRAFDVPFLNREFGIPFLKPHIDLCFWLRRHGYRGGLKKVQKMFAHIPDRQSLDIDGYDAVRLWHMHRRGVAGALETLLTYNAEDTVVLEALMIEAYNLEAAAQPEPKPQPLAPRPLPILDTRVHPDIYSQLRL